NAALEHIAHAEFIGDFTDISGISLERKARIAGDDKEPPLARQTRDDVLGEAVGEVFLYRIAAPILKWQHRNRWLVGQGERRPQRGGSLRPARLIVHHGLLLHGFGVRHFARPVRVVHAADETEAALVVRANQRLVRTVVPDHSTNGAHAGTQRRLRDDATLPYGVYQLFPA